MSKNRNKSENRRKRAARSAKKRAANRDRSQSAKATIVAEAEALWHARYTPFGPIESTCLQWAMALVEVGRRHGRRFIMQAGSLYWPRIDLSLDDGLVHTHFAYEWEGMTDLNQHKLANQIMPEMHVWVAEPSVGEIIDLTTRFLPYQCLATAGLPWEAPEPPAYVWGTAKSLPRHVMYKADPTAIVVAEQLAARGLKALATPGTIIMNGTTGEATVVS